MNDIFNPQDFMLDNEFELHWINQISFKGAAIMANKKLRKLLTKEELNAITKRLEQKSDIKEHQDRDCGRQTSEASRGDSIF